MKYFVVSLKGKELIFVFPRSIDHNRMHEAVCGIRHGAGHNWRREYAEAISAGFIDGGKCHGRSDTLDLDSRGELDAILLRGNGDSQ
ncbi:hypothetical protein PQR39_35390 [Paraburkholderia sediminicola]|uniref:hypothetical protein n=1 Tax=Paraburkholderia sediminicola TaxID=458836 RepID=UPI0038BCF843